MHQIAVRALTAICAAHDTMDTEDLGRMVRMVVNGEYLHRPNGSHLAMWDDQAANYGAC